MATGSLRTLIAHSPDTINSVVVSGLALSEPRVHYLAANQVAAHFSLGLRPCNFRLDLPQQPQGAVFVDSWGLLALQLQQHVHKGDRVQVRGVLREDTWTDNATGKPRRAVKIIAEELALVAPPTDQHVEGLPPQHQEQEQEEADGEEPHFPPAQAQALQRPRMSLSAEQSLHMYQQMGLGLEAIAAARGIKMSTVIEHLLAAAEVGAFPTACWQRLASDVCLGASDAWLSPAEVAEAVMAVEQENPGVELRAIPLRAIRQRLAEGEGTSAKVAELQSSRGGDPSLVYGAILLHA
ncbi:hypothetical protein CHLNCDRAFT_140280 [Chlorella variabilis]|uniref:Helicase Helix-turn-helix domain-containing protein n=1 Tax=Chlorella variabilis TaxID=554065 RepID=E1Z6N7_CHLVA|nr:hypothetical protein CHLNCDRAFT_140280 [Chlorella variabilis]EFN58382.1 hypothetical protein CHLNCDRAFT_140280 [Chlorella variabilis]|eukprot:XP_005850484.1 hypothetical protein CHLNCDRAFT_140280 [Chlorella variabilis]